MKARSVALRDQLVALLRDADEPLATAQVAAHSGLPMHEQEWWCRCSEITKHDGHCVGGLLHGHKVLACADSEDQGHSIYGTTAHVVAIPPVPSMVYQHLRALEDRGVVQRVWMPNMRAVYWAYVNTESDEAMNKLLDNLAKGEQ